MLLNQHKKILKEGAKEGILPTNVLCRSGCKFCYEKYIRQDFPDIDITTIPQYNDESFLYFMKSLQRRAHGISPQSILGVEDNVIKMGPNADFFNLGLTPNQIDQILDKCTVRYPIYLYTTGIGIDKSYIWYLTNRHRGKFILRLSALTFNDNIKSQIVVNYTPSTKIKEIIGAAHLPRVMLLSLSFKQMIEDLYTLNQLNSDGVSVLISTIFYTEVYPKHIKKLSDNGHNDFPKVIEYLKNHINDFQNFTDIRFLVPAEAHAWKHRNFIKNMLRDVGHNDAIICSKASFETIRRVVDSDTFVFSVSNPAGGNMNFATTVTTKAVTSRIDELVRQNYSIKRIFLPSAIWWIEDNYDIIGHPQNNLHQCSFSVEFVVLSIPLHVLKSTLSLQDCFDYYSQVRGIF